MHFFKKHTFILLYHEYRNPARLLRMHEKGDLLEKIGKPVVQTGRKTQYDFSVLALATWHPFGRIYIFLAKRQGGFFFYRFKFNDLKKMKYVYLKYRNNNEKRNTNNLIKSNHIFFYVTSLGMKLKLQLFRRRKKKWHHLGCHFFIIFLKLCLQKYNSKTISLSDFLPPSVINNDETQWKFNNKSYKDHFTIP